MEDKFFKWQIFIFSVSTKFGREDIMSGSQPLAILQKAINNLILVKLKDGRTIQGRLSNIDAYMNLCLTNAEELDEDGPIARYGEVFIRGNNILFIKPDLTEELPSKEEGEGKQT